MSTNNKEQVKWLTVVILAIVFISIIIHRFSNTPITTMAYKIAFSSLEQDQNLSTSSFTELAPRIEAICISGNGQPVAYVGGKFVHEGATVNGFKLLKIYPNKVIFVKNGNTVVGVFPDKRRPLKPESDHLQKKQVSYKNSSNNQIQYRQSTYSIPSIAENGSYYGQISENTGRPKTVYVRGYYRKDGTYVRSHYRSPPTSSGASLSSKTYLLTGNGHWVKKIIDSGNFIQLEDDSLWQVNPIDKIICQLWLYTEEIVVIESQSPIYPYYLINADDGEKIEAKLISD